jgi:hypothetical protein
MLDGMEVGWRDTLVLMPRPVGVGCVFRDGGGGDDRISDSRHNAMKRVEMVEY